MREIQVRDKYLNTIYSLLNEKSSLLYIDRNQFCLIQNKLLKLL